LSQRRAQLYPLVSLSLNPFVSEAASVSFHFL
jgi:hypothetical protein